MNFPKKYRLILIIALIFIAISIFRPKENIIHTEHFGLFSWVAPAITSVARSAAPITAVINNSADAPSTLIYDVQAKIAKIGRQTPKSNESIRKGSGGLQGGMNKITNDISNISADIGKKASQEWHNKSLKCTERELKHTIDGKASCIEKCVPTYNDVPLSKNCMCDEIYCKVGDVESYCQTDMEAGSPDICYKKGGNYKNLVKAWKTKHMGDANETGKGSNVDHTGGVVAGKCKKGYEFGVATVTRLKDTGDGWDQGEGLGELAVKDERSDQTSLTKNVEKTVCVKCSNYKIDQWKAYWNKAADLIGTSSALNEINIILAPNGCSTGAKYKCNPKKDEQASKGLAQPMVCNTETAKTTRILNDLKSGKHIDKDFQDGKVATTWAADEFGSLF